MKLADLIGGSVDFRRNVKKVLAAGVFAQAIGMISLPALSRLFSPESFGALTAFILVQSIALSFITGRIEWLVPNARNIRSAKRFLAAASYALVLFTILVYLSFAIFSRAGIHFSSVEREGLGAEMVAAGAFLGGLFLVLQACSVYANDLQSMSRAKILQAILTLSASLIFGYLGLTGNGLILSYVLGFFGAVLVMRSELKLLVTAISEVRFNAIARVYRAYSKRIIASVSLSLVNVLFQSILAALIIYFYSAAVAGWYGLVYRVATAPIGLVTTSVSRSFWAESARLVKSDPVRLHTFYLQSVKRLAIASIPFSIVFLMGPLYIPVVFGADQWSGAGEILASLTPLLVGMIIFSPTTHLIVYGKAHWQLWVDASACIFSILVFWAAFDKAQSPSIPIFFASSIMFIGYFIRFLVHLKANSQLIKRREIASF